MKSLLQRLILPLALLASGCGPGADPDSATPGTDAGSDAAEPFAPDRVCPGDPDCTGTGGDGNLYVGVAMRNINPYWETWTDVDGSGDYDDTIDTYDDLNGNGVFDAVWLANELGQPMEDVRSDLWARTIVLRVDDITIAINAVDFYGYFRDDIEAIRALVPAALDVDFIEVSASHSHRSPDTLGISGPALNESGVDPVWMDSVHAAVAANIADAVAALQPADVTYASVDTEDPTYGYEPYVSDTRHPIVLDPTMTILKFTAELDGSTIGTMINWGAHAEYEGENDPLLSSDWPHWLRTYVSDGVNDFGDAVPGIGGMTMFINGAIGGQVGQGWVVARAPDGTTYSSNGPEKAQFAARAVSLLALDALQNGSLTEDTMDLGFTYERFPLHIANRGYHLFFLFGIIDREVFNYEPGVPIDEDNLPWVWSEAAHLTLGRAEVITCPGELFPEFFIGGYDGSYSGMWPVITPGVENPPDLAMAPPPPYMRDLMTGDYRMVWGLTGDMVGYVMPEFEFLLHPQTPYIKEAAGDHYEETNSVGPNADPEVAGTMTKLLTWKPGI